MRNDGFVLSEFRGVRYYSCTVFEQIPRLCHGFSIRRSASAAAGSYPNRNCSSPDCDEGIHENPRRFLSALNLESAQLATLRQVHSNRVYIIEDNAGEGNRSEGDALATVMEDVALAVRTADCLPVLIADPVKRAVAAVHSGWRGTLSRVLFQTILAMRTSFGSSPSDLLVAVGPGIRACCFEVGPEVAELFDKEYPGSRLANPAEGRPGKYLLDLYRALDVQLDLAGVRAENCYDLGACTCCNTDRFFSYRAEGPGSGRMLAVIGMRKD